MCSLVFFLTKQQGGADCGRDKIAPLDRTGSSQLIARLSAANGNGPGIDACRWLHLAGGFVGADRPVADFWTSGHLDAVGWGGVPRGFRAGGFPRLPWHFFLADVLSLFPLVSGFPFPIPAPHSSNGFSIPPARNRHVSSAVEREERRVRDFIAGRVTHALTCSQVASKAHNSHSLPPLRLHSRRSLHTPPQHAVPHLPRFVSALLRSSLPSAVRRPPSFTCLALPPSLRPVWLRVRLDSPATTLVWSAASMKPQQSTTST